VSNRERVPADALLNVVHALARSKLDDAINDGHRENRAGAPFRADEQVDEQKAMCIIEGMVPKTCTVSVTDASSSRHSVEVLAESLYEAAALGLKLLRDADWVDTLGPMTRLQLQVRAPTVMHEVTIQQLQRSLDGAPISPHEAVLKARLKSILK
jgi:hypothetical protein